MEQQTVHYRENSRLAPMPNPSARMRRRKGRRSAILVIIFEVAEKIRKQNSRAQSLTGPRSGVTALGPGQRNGELTTP